MSILKNVVAILAVLIVLAGCSSNEPRKTSTKTTTVTTKTTTPAEKRVVVQTQSAPCSIECLINVKPTAPREAVLGNTYEAGVDISGVDNSGDVSISTTVPQGAKYVRSEPAAQVNGNRLTWKFDSINKNQKQSIRVWLQPTQEGNVGLCFTATASPKYCVSTSVGKPVLVITKTGPATAPLGGNVTYNIVVENKGTAIARGVSVTDNIPDGLVHSEGKRSLTFQVGDLAPKASKSFKVTVKASRRGNFCNVATVASSNAGTSNSKACTRVLKEDILLTCSSDKQKFVGERSNNQVSVNNPGDTTLKNVTMTATLCSLATLVSADGSPQQQAGKLTWKIGDLAPGQSRSYKIVMLGKKEGDCCMKTSVTANGNMSKSSDCCTKWVGVPKLEITKSGPATAKLGGNFNYKVVVRSTGTGTAQNVVVTDNIPAGLDPVSGSRNVKFNVGNMAPGTSKEFTVAVKAAQVGNFCNVADAQGSNAKKVSAKACTKVLRQAANLAITCPPESFLGKRASNKITITNTGDVALTRVVVTGSWDSGMRVISADGSPSLAGNKAVWNIASLPAGKSLSYGIVSVSKTPGKQCIDLTLTCAEGITKKASCCTLWKGFPAILLEVIDTNDPLLIDEETTYVIEVTNQGTALDRNIRIVANFPAEITPLSVTGDTKGTITGKNVSFAAYPILNPKDKIKFVIRAKGVKTGDSRLKVELHAESLGSRPVNEEESTQVY